MDAAREFSYAVSGAASQVLAFVLSVVEGVLYFSAFVLRVWLIALLIVAMLWARWSGTYREVEPMDFAKADRVCADDWVDKYDVSPRCVLSPNRLSCRWKRFMEYGIHDFLAPYDGLGIDQQILETTESDEVMCTVWYRSGELEWREFSPMFSYQDMACMCRRIEQPLSDWSNYYLYVSSHYMELAACGVGAFIALLLSIILLVWLMKIWKRNQAQGNCHPKAQTVACKWTFDKAKHTNKAEGQQHKHPFLNTLRSSVRKALLQTVCQIHHSGQVVNLFGTPDDAKDMPAKLANRLTHLQTASAYNATRTDGGVTYYNTYDGAVQGAAQQKDVSAVVIYDSAWYMSADQIAALVAGGKTIYFNMKTKPKGKHEIRDPYTGQLESVIRNDGITYKESVIGGDDYTHRAANFPRKDNFCLRHDDLRILFKRVRMSAQKELVESGFDYDQYETVYCAHMFVSEYDDGLLIDHFSDKPVETKLILDKYGRVTGAYIPDASSTEKAVKRLPEDQFTVCLNCLSIPPSASCQKAVTNKIVQSGFIRDREYMVEVAMMLRAREAALSLIAIDEGLWGYLKNAFMIRWGWAIVVQLGVALGYGCKHVETYRCVTEDSLKENAIGQNSQEARDETDGSGGDDTSGSTVGGGGSGSADGSGLVKKATTKGKTNANGGDKQAAKTDKPVCDPPKEGAATPSKQGGNSGKVKDTPPATGKGNSGKPPAKPGKGDSVGGKTGSDSVAGKASAKTKAKASTGKAGSGDAGGQTSVNIDLSEFFKQHLVEYWKSTGVEAPSNLADMFKVCNAKPKADSGKNEDPRSESDAAGEQDDGRPAQKPADGPNVGSSEASAEGDKPVDQSGDEPGTHKQSVPESGALEQSSQGDLPDAAGNADASWTLVQLGRKRAGKTAVSRERSNDK